MLKTFDKDEEIAELTKHTTWELKDHPIFTQKLSKDEIFDIYR